MKILIILIAIAGTVAGGVHAYVSRNQYIETAMLSEAYVLIAPIKLRVAEYYLQKGVMPHNNAEAGLLAPEANFGTSVKRISVSRGGVLQVDFDDELGKADMVFTPTLANTGGIFSWRCTSDSLEPALLDKLRPTCSHLPSTLESKLMKAIANNDLDRLEPLISAGADVNAVVNGNSPLMLAARTGNSAALKYLVAQQANIDHPGVNGDRRTPLMVAIAGNRADIAAYLLNHGASVLSTDYQGKSALDYARETDAGLGGDRYERLVTARLNPNFAGSRESNLGSDTAARDEKLLRTMYATLRSIAHDCDTQRLRSTLIGVGEFPTDALVAGEALDSHKLKPACSLALTAVIEKTAVYQEALHARLSGAFRTCDALTVSSTLEDNAQVDIIGDTDDGASYFDMAVRSGCADIVSDLVRHHSLAGRIDSSLLTDVIQGVRHENLLRLVGTLIEAGADVNAKSGEQQTALIASIAAGQPVIAKFLIDAGADVNARSVDGSYPIIEASKKGYQRLVSQLVAAGADIHTNDAMGRTAIIAAVAQGKSRLVKTLLGAGANPHQRDHDGVSARILAESSGKRSIKKLIAASDTR